MLTIITREEGGQDNERWTRETYQYFATKLLGMKAAIRAGVIGFPFWTLHDAIRHYDKFQPGGKSLQRAGEIISLLEKAS